MSTSTISTRDQSCESRSRMTERAGEVEQVVQDEGLVGADGMTIDEDGTLYVAVNAANEVVRVTDDQEIETLAGGDPSISPRTSTSGPPRKPRRRCTSRTSPTGPSSRTRRPPNQASRESMSEQPVTSRRPPAKRPIRTRGTTALTTISPVTTRTRRTTTISPKTTRTRRTTTSDSANALGQWSIESDPPGG